MVWHNVIYAISHRSWSESEGKRNALKELVLNNERTFALLLTTILHYSVQSRLNCEDGLTFCEMTYQLMQGYDFYHLNRSHGVNVQIGGSDQWGNMLTGLELAEKLTGRTVACLTMPLLTNAKGEKMGKSSGNGVWLDPSMTCVYDFYQVTLEMCGLAVLNRRHSLIVFCFT